MRPADTLRERGKIMDTTKLNAADRSARADGKPVRPEREERRLPATLGRRLSAYAAAAAHNPHRFRYTTAAALGVGLLGLAPAAEADIVYTPANISISARSSFLPFTFPLQFAGRNQLTFLASKGFNAPTCFDGLGCVWEDRMSVKPGSGNGLALGPLAAGYRIGPRANFGNGGSIDLFAFGTSRNPSGSFVKSSGPWAPNRSGYLGLEFQIDGQTHYGWVALSVFEGTGDVTGYAYDTVANQPIAAGQTTETPEPGTLGLLALGSLGLGYWRRTKAVGD